MLQTSKFLSLVTLVEPILSNVCGSILSNVCGLFRVKLVEPILINVCRTNFEYYS